MLFFDTHGVTHPTQERRAPCLPAEMQNRKYWQLRNPLPKPLMGSGLIEVHRIRFEKPGELLLLAGSDMGFGAF
jgi:hypothetical protein